MAALVPPQESHPTAFQSMSVASGIIAYALIIRRGCLDRSYGMPIVAVCANISREFIFTFLIPHARPQHCINAGWLFFDGCIFFNRRCSGAAIKKRIPVWRGL